MSMPAGGNHAQAHVLSLLDVLGAKGGGAERMARELVARLDPDRFRRTLCVTRLSESNGIPEDLSLARDLESQGVRVLSLGRRGKLDVIAWRPLLNYLRQENVQVLHSHMFGSNVWASTLGSLAEVPVIVAHEHGWSYEGQPVRRFLDRALVSRACDAIIASSELARNRMIEVEGIDPGRTRLVYISNGIASPRPTGSSIRAELGIADAAPLVLTVARLDPYKALHVLLHAAAYLKDDFPDIRILIAGDGPDRVRLERLIAELGLQQVVLLLGSRMDVPDLIAACDVATLCSYSETTPLAIMEYMAMAKPVVATRAGGIPDLIEDGVHGLLVEPEHSAGLASAIATLLRGPDRARELGEQARQRQQREFSIDVVVHRVQQLYEELLLDHAHDRRSAASRLRSIRR
jgi:glycosyltransferase involved in cell wall biosynthesis